jgi:hypothetical protein
MLQEISIAVEVIIVVFSVLIFIRKKQIYGYGFALTFLLYVFYDLVRLLNFSVDEGLIRALFFVATLSGLVAIINAYGGLRIPERKKKS